MEHNSYLEAKACVVLNFFQKDGVRPRPLVVEAEEASEESAGCTVWIELADPSHEDGPVDASKVSHDV